MDCSTLWFPSTSECYLNHISSSIVNEARTRLSRTNTLVRYFFCRAVDETEGDLRTLLKNLLHQIVYNPPREKRTSIAKHFMEAIPAQRLDEQDVSLKEALLRASIDKLQTALTGLIEEREDLVVFVDGADPGRITIGDLLPCV
ncbi:hypothetical protein BDV23DRAFT_187011 [Aspergillus alliaceus]|nr:hypothetical protein BDV23DRAFT_187011 [Aspergillus alliaceus]